MVHTKTTHILLENFKKERSFEKMFQLLETDQNLLSELVAIIKNLEPYPYPEYASWILTHYVEKYPERIKPFQADLIDTLFLTDKQTVLRNVLNTLQALDISNYREAELIDLLIGFIQDNANKVALQVYSIYYLTKFLIIYPEITNEIKSIIELDSQNKSAAYSAAIRKFNKIINKKK